MEKAPLKIIYLIFVLILFAYSGFCQPNFTPSAFEEMVEELNQADDLLFDAIFENCEIDVLEEMVTDDVEFYHDKGGKIASSKDELVARIKSGCDLQAAGENNASRRVLDRSSVEVYPLANYGAIHRGIHDFYQQINSEFTYVESARFTHVWKKEGDKWRLARILSFDHSPEPVSE